MVPRQVIIEREFFTTAELEQRQGGCFVYDVEVFRNYFLFAFKCRETGKYGYFEAINDETVPAGWIMWFITTFCLVGFNNKAFDNIISSMAATGRHSVADLKEATWKLIVGGNRPSDVCKEYGFELMWTNDVDLIEVAPLTGSLKKYAARINCRHMQDLPYDPEATLTREEIANVRTYCFNDLDNTDLLLTELEPSLALRAALSQEFSKDLRSLSDAQLAQEIINTEIARITGKVPKRPGFEKLVGTSFRYKPPSYISFVSPELNSLLKEVSEADIVVGESGHVVCPKSIDGRKIVIGGRQYTIGMGGLHSNETRQTVIQTNYMRVLDRDVTGYYPNLILKNKFAPEHLGEVFLTALQTIVDKRYAAKKAERKTEADGLKIASNGTFGKTSDPYSTIYSPPMMVQTTLTGQFSLMMAVEWLTLEGFQVISANTDGIVTLCPHDRYELFCSIFAAWEKRTGLETEETEYRGLYSRDVNNYIAIKMDGKHKAKGAYSEFGSALNSPLSKNPSHFVCMDAVVAFLTKGIPLEKTIYDCDKITRFVDVREARGGAQKDGKFLGKVVRWYYAKGITGDIRYCTREAKVNLSDGAKPLMTLPDHMPTDIDYDRYILLATEILEDIGFQRKKNEQLALI